MRNRILRVSNHPSKEHHGVGLHPYMISDTSKFETFFVSPQLKDGDAYLRSEKYELFVSKIKFDKRPVAVNFIKLIIFHFTRGVKLIKHSFFCIKLARKHKVNIVHIHSPMYFLVSFWGKLNGKLTCITYHGTDYLRIKESKIYQFLSKRFIDVGFCISPHMIKKMKSNHRFVKYIPNGVDTSIFFDKNMVREKMILAVGSLKKEKSYDQLIKAFSKVVENYPEYNLHIAGDGILREELENLVRSEGISDKVVFLGNLNVNQLVDKYNSAESFILSSYSEGFPKVVLEAIFSGCKVVATDVGSVSTFLPDRYVIPDDSVENLYKYLVKIIEEDNYEINTSKLKVRYTWPNVIDNYGEAYNNNIR